MAAKWRSNDDQMTIEHYNLVSPPAIEPLSAESDQMLRHLSLLSMDAATEAYVQSLIVAAREVIERDTSRQLITATWKLTRDCFPVARPIELKRPPVQSNPTIEYYDTDDVLQTFAASKYQIFLGDPDKPGKVEPVAGQAWPGTADRVDAVQLTFVAGYGDSQDGVPEVAKHAMRLLIGDWWIDRAGKGQVNQAIRGAYDALTDRLVWRGYS